MEFLSFLADYPIPFLVLLTVVVFVHELGHFWVARQCGVKVEVFSVGFGPELLGVTDRHGTRWKFSAIPLGGYVKMFGQSETVSAEGGAEREMTAAEKSVSFHHKGLGQRTAIVAAGPAANYALTVVAFLALFATFGEPVSLLPTVGTVATDSGAEAAGILPGDRILEVDGKPISQFEELVAAVESSRGRPLSLKLQRGDEQIDLTAQPRLMSDPSTATDSAPTEHFRLGITPGYDAVYERRGIVEAAINAVSQTYVRTVVTLQVLGQMIVGSRSSQEIGGVIGIAKIAGDQAQKSLPDFLFLIPILSLNLGLLNLFPIPLLDGGHLVFYAIERLRGRPLGANAQEWGARIGLTFVLGLMVFATWNDLVRLQVVEFIKNLVV
ncbi:MAG: RIP metalloprotease RseP [Dongiaceae bacterium]